MRALGDPSVLIATAGNWQRTSAGTELLCLLAGWERHRHSRLPRGAAQEGFVVAHALLRLVVARVTSLPVADIELSVQCTQCGSAEHGRPFVADSRSGVNTGVSVSLAHSGDWVAVAVSGAGPVGVDVERNAATAFPGFPDVALSSRETAPSERERAIVWTRKEAILKASGHGLTVFPADLTVSAPDSPPELHGWRGSGRPDTPVQLRDLRPDRDHSGAVAVFSRGSVDFRMIDGDELVRRAVQVVQSRTTTR